MKYNAAITATKMTTPGIVVIGGAYALQWVANLAGTSVNDDMAYKVATGAFGLIVGLVNYFKNRKKSR